MNHPGVVVIGRNEGERLRRSLASLAAERPRVVYVDSGSTDGSVALARSVGVDVVALDPERPFSAARARNEGLDRCLALHPEVRSVMFVDGDCEVVAGWLDRALAELDRHPEVAVICGRRRELHPERSVYNRLADLEWATPVGLTRSCGGDALVRVADFRAVGGFDPSVRAGEEPELCQRLRRRGREILRIDAEMTRHDLNMTRFVEWWRRQTRVGYHGLDIERRFPPPLDVRGKPTPSLFGSTLHRARVWGFGVPLVVLLAAITLGIWSSVGAALVAGGVGLAIFIAQGLRLAWKIRKRVDRRSDALAYGGLMVLEKWANLAGQIHHVRDRLRGRGARLIEYKTSIGATPAQRVGDL